MKQLIVLFLTLGLVGCAGTLPPLPTPTVSTGSLNVTQIKGAIAEVKRIAVQACAFEPTERTVAAILSTLGVPVIGGLSEIAQQICTSVTTAPLADGPGDHRPRVAGIIIRGRHVRR